MGKGPAVHVLGVEDFQKEMRAAGKEWAAALRKTNKKAADIVVPAARDKVGSLTLTANSGKPSGRIQARVAQTIRSAGSQTQASVMAGNASLPYTFGALLGGHAQQFPAHVGSDWTPGEAGGPYGLGPAVAEKVPDIIDAYGQMLDDLYAKAFPDH